MSRGGNISHIWRVHKERDEKQPPLFKAKERKIKRFDDGERERERGRERGERLTVSNIHGSFSRLFSLYRLLFS